jgi:peptidoglycan hydrolase-like protein with peptidoglycan-binding domain
MRSRTVSVVAASPRDLTEPSRFNVGAPDGKLGSRTVAAIRQFQELSGLEVTGAITPEVIAEMRDRAG